MGTHEGEIKPSDSITVSTLYTYPCAGTGEHTESIELYDENDTLIANGTWNGYIGDYCNITIPNKTGEAPYVTLLKGHKYLLSFQSTFSLNSFSKYLFLLIQPPPLVSHPLRKIRELVPRNPVLHTSP